MIFFTIVNLLIEYYVLHLVLFHCEILIKLFFDMKNVHYTNTLTDLRL